MGIFGGHKVNYLGFAAEKDQKLGKALTIGGLAIAAIGCVVREFSEGWLTREELMKAAEDGVFVKEGIIRKTEFRATHEYEECEQA